MAAHLPAFARTYGLRRVDYWGDGAGNPGMTVDEWTLYLDDWTAEQQKHREGGGRG